MSGKSITFSILSLITFIGIIIGIVFLFKLHFVLGIVGIFLIFIPIKLNRKAVEEVDGLFDKVLAKYVVPVVALIGVIFIVLLFTLWI
ncbi:MAG: hypothetical protein IJ837_04720 [Clostridia bacterium]|nr:hypothetical protein [Clostridia bacterium]